MNRTYYSMEDLITQEYIVMRRGAFGWQANSLSELLDLGTNGYPNDRSRVPSNDPVFSNAYVSELFKKHVWPQYYDKPILYMDGNILFSSDEANDIKNSFAGALYSWLTSTAERYGTLIANLNDAKAHLMDRIKTISRYNDTPQGEDDYSDTEHTTTITVSEAEGTTLMARLNEIENNLKELYRQWSFEFGQTFVIWSA